MSATRWMILALALTAVAACRPRDDQRTDTIDPAEAQRQREELPADLVAQLDSGSAAYRAQDYEGALAHYQAAARIDDGVAAAWFGVYMAQHALGHEEEASKALAKVQEVAPGASLVHPTSADTAR